MNLRALFTAGVAGLCLAHPATGEAAFDAKVYGATTNIRPGVALGNGMPNGASLSAAGNEFESFQVVAEGPIGALSVEPGAELTRAGGGGSIRIASGDPASRMTIYRVGMYNVPAEPGRSDLEGALGAWPDALIPEVDPIYGENRSAWPIAVPAGGREVAWIDIHVPPNQPAGTYTGSVLVKDGADVIDTVPITLVVHPFTLPSTSSLDSAFYTGYSKPCQAHTGAILCNGDAQLGYKLHALYARVALENRVTLANPWMLGVDQAPTTDAQKTLFNQYVLPLLDGTGAGEGSRARRLSGARLNVISQYWQCGAACLTAWRTFLPADVRDRFVYYACDEPPNADCTWQLAADRLAMAQAAWPGVARLVTTPPPRASDEAITPDVLAPVVNHVDGKNCCGSPYVGNQRQTQAYLDFLDPASDQAGTAANRLWMYTSNMSHGANPPCPQPDPEAPANACADYDTNSVNPLWAGWPGYVIDQPAAQARAMGWLAFGYDVSGELYWHVSQQLPNAWTSQWDSGGHGDGTLFYPGTPARIGGASDIPIESLRLKRIRDGREDYEYLRLADEVAAKQVFRDVFGATSAMFNVTDAIGDDDFAAAREQLAESIGGTEPAPQSCDDPTITGTPGGDPNLVGTPGDDVIVGLGGDDTIRGLGGNDMLCGGDGFDTLDGGSGDDTLYGEAAEFGHATNAVTVDLDAQRATGDGVDTLFGVFEVYGSPFADKLSGADFNGSVLEYLAGVGGDDVIDGRGGRDWVQGGPGDDTVTGGEGTDLIDGNDGVDILSARDGESDLRVDCGADADPVATLDASDPTSGCEQIDDGVDRVAPDTTIVSASEGVFSFVASEGGATFECSLDGGPFAPCSSPQAYGGLAAGDHGFAVRARDAAGNTDPTPATTTWRVPSQPQATVTAVPTPTPLGWDIPFSCLASAPRQTLGAARRRGVSVSLRCSSPARITLRVTVSRRTARKWRLVRSLRGGEVTVGTGTVSGGTARVKLSARAHRAFKRARTVSVTVHVSARAADGQIATRRLAIALRR